MGRTKAEIMCDAMFLHVAKRMSILEAMIPQDEKAKTVKFARTNELEQLMAALAEAGEETE